MLSEQLRVFAEEQGFTHKNQSFAGVYDDMFLNLSLNGESGLNLFIAIKEIRKMQKQTLEKELNKHSERFHAQIQTENTENGIAVFFSGDDALTEMRGFLNECDLLLRPYTREQGILCALCGKELKTKAEILFYENGARVLPVCEDCANHRTGTGENRKTAYRKRVRKGFFGALLGMAAAMLLWAILFWLNLGMDYLAALLMPFVIHAVYTRFGGLADRYEPWLIGVCGVFALIFGYLIALAVNLFAILLPSGATFAECCSMVGQIFASQALGGGFSLNALLCFAATAIGSVLSCGSRFKRG